MSTKKIWKVWDSKLQIFFTWDFTDYEILKNQQWYNFYYNEIYDWNFSDTKCIYEMSDCILNENDIVVDLGSNVGLFTRYASEKCSKVISVEGSPEYFSCLIENTFDLKNIKYLNANVVSESDKSSNTWSDNKSEINLTIKDIFYLYDLDVIDFLKIDIEGGEYSIFNDINENYLRRIKKIAIETHDSSLNEKLSSIIIKSGKRLYYFDWYIKDKLQTMYYFY